MISYRWPRRYLLQQIEALIEDLEGREDITNEGNPNKAMTTAETLRQCYVLLDNRPKAAPEEA